MDHWLRKAISNQPEDRCEMSSSEFLIAPSTSSIKVDDTIESEVKNTKKTRKYKFCECWLQESNLKNWLTKSKDMGKHKECQAFCKLCQVNILPQKATLLKHRQSTKHKFLEKQVSTSSDLSKLLNNPLSEKTR
ncbi:uncharacterized protein [Leptinotarsa decemlineata]|uniref:uncharacterized protein n=1 Tax=Leptinotarsa decemlineata TaxID=7539 RepID=UPI003D307382